jgi:hypothetical protein
MPDITGNVLALLDEARVVVTKAHLVPTKFVGHLVLGPHRDREGADAVELGLVSGVAELSPFVGSATRSQRYPNGTL